MRTVRKKRPIFPRPLGLVRLGMDQGDAQRRCGMSQKMRTKSRPAVHVRLPAQTGSLCNNRRGGRCGQMNNQSTGNALSIAPTKILQNIALQIRDPTNASPNSTGISQVWATQTSSPVKISHLQKHKDVLSKDYLSKSGQKK
ncbi:MAG: hypothetical protein ABFD06_04840 [Smithella sp.]